MIEIGMVQELTVINKTDFGIYLASADKLDEKVLLPKKQVPEGCVEGDTVKVFIYRDSDDRLIATVREPRMVLGEIALLEVKEVTGLGAFLDWGLEKDLFLPYKEQRHEVCPGEVYPIALYVDKSGRLCGTMRIYDYLQEDSPYEKDSQVKGMIYEIHEELGAFVAVDNKYHGLIPQNELLPSYKEGDMVAARVSSVRSDGKLNLSIRKKAYLQMDEDAEAVLQAMERCQGVLPFTDKSADAEQIKKEFCMSKNAFKRAVGRLLKENRIRITDSSIELLDSFSESQEADKEDF